MSKDGGDAGKGGLDRLWARLSVLATKQEHAVELAQLKERITERQIGALADDLADLVEDQKMTASKVQKLENWRARQSGVEEGRAAAATSGETVKTLEAVGEQRLAEQKLQGSTRRSLLELVFTFILGGGLMRIILAIDQCP